MITCTIRYVLDPDKLDAFETYARAWVALVPRFGGVHHGYFLPHEGANDVAWAMFSFPSLAAYEAYRTESMDDADCRAAYAFARETGCIRSYERSFTRPVLEGSLDGLRMIEGREKIEGGVPSLPGPGGSGEGAR